MKNEDDETEWYTIRCDQQGNHKWTITIQLSKLSGLVCTFGVCVCSVNMLYVV